MLPPTTSTCGKFFLTHLTRSSTPCEWPWAVSTTSRSTPASTSSGAFLRAGPDADGGADAQAAEAVLAGERVLGGLEDVLHGDQPAQLEVAVDDEHALEPVLVHQGLGLVEDCSLP
jgi:hypothetical protein